ncbi:ABC transporter permease [Natronorubrum sp. DTA28]|uniref:ABC transporter permease n=1 Tax=Natronorubrum sp. DTA28 TaxID=3447019 RepID=UPI003F872239
MTDRRTAASASGGVESSSAGFLVLLWTIFRMNLLLTIRYRVNFAAMIVGMYFFFALVFFGGQAAAESVGGGAGALGDTLDALIVGWFLWTMVQSAYSSLSQEITQESRWGTLEQLYVSPHGFSTILASKVVVNILMSLLIGLVMLVLMLVTTGRTVSFDVASVLPIVLLTLLTAIGLGYVFAGLALIYKQLSNLSEISQFLLIGLIAAPAADIPALSVLPLVHGSDLLQRTMRDGVQIWEFSAQDVGLLIGTAVSYAAVGYLCFVYCSRVARERGVMGHY